MCVTDFRLIGLDSSAWHLFDSVKANEEQSQKEWPFLDFTAELHANVKFLHCLQQWLNFDLWHTLLVLLSSTLDRHFGTAIIFLFVHFVSFCLPVKIQLLYHETHFLLKGLFCIRFPKELSLIISDVIKLTFLEPKSDIYPKSCHLTTMWEHSKSMSENTVIQLVLLVPFSCQLALYCSYINREIEVSVEQKKHPCFHGL